MERKSLVDGSFKVEPKADKPKNFDPNPVFVPPYEGWNVQPEGWDV